MTSPRDPLLYRPQQVQQLDRAAIAGGIDGFDLMRRAGRAAFRLLRRTWPQAKRLLVLCGGGNNGGDGYVVAGMARQQGLQVVCVALSPVEQLQGEARQAWQWALDQGLVTATLTGDDQTREQRLAEWLRYAELVVDSLLGIGLSGEVREPYRWLIAQVNQSDCPVLAIDGPSGLCAETGQALGAAMVADLTVSFIGRKAGFYTGQARHYTGPVAFDDLGVPEAVFAQVQPARARLLSWPAMAWQLPPL
ncbi:MAG: NAD(P)H-hydrate epimerase, partial [Halomonadaceae bacterium]